MHCPAMQSFHLWHELQQFIQIEPASRVGSGRHGPPMSRPVEQKPRFSEAIKKLEMLRSSVIEDLKRGDDSRLQVKLQLDDAIQCLRFCEAHAITASAKVIQLPQTRTRTPSSEYRIFEDHETEDREFWTELKIGTVEVRPSPGTLLIDCGLWPNDAEPA